MVMIWFRYAFVFLAGLASGIFFYWAIEQALAIHIIMALLVFVVLSFYLYGIYISQGFLGDAGTKAIFCIGKGVALVFWMQMWLGGVA
jgi:hypothetical protein